jgi:D-sedoheptulose 7-phosphate isomerase
MQTIITEQFKIHQQLIENACILLRESIGIMAVGMTDCFKRGDKILLAGNGGSAADTQHFVAELVGFIGKKRLTGNSLDHRHLHFNRCG